MRKRALVRLARPSMFMVPRKLVLMVLMGLYLQQALTAWPLAAGRSARQLLHSMGLGVLDSAARATALAGRFRLVLDSPCHLGWDRRLASTALVEAQTQAGMVFKESFSRSVDVKGMACWMANCVQADSPACIDIEMPCLRLGVPWLSAYWATCPLLVHLHHNACSLVVDGRGWAGEVVDLVHLQQDALRDVVAHHLKVGLANEVQHVLLAAREEIVQADHLHHQSSES